LLIESALNLDTSGIRYLKLRFDYKNLKKFLTFKLEKKTTSDVRLFISKISKNVKDKIIKICKKINF